jgi:hypothetical protein
LGSGGGLGGRTMNEAQKGSAEPGLREEVQGEAVFGSRSLASHLDKEKRPGMTPGLREVVRFPGPASDYWRVR